MRDLPSSAKNNGTNPNQANNQRLKVGNDRISKTADNKQSNKSLTGDRRPATGDSFISRSIFYISCPNRNDRDHYGPL